MHTWKLALSAALIPLLVACAQTPPPQPAPSDSPPSAAASTDANLATATATERKNPEKGAVIEQIMQLSGMNEIIEQIPAGVAMGFDQQPVPPINQSDYLAFRQSLIDSFDPPTIRQTLVDYLRHHYDAERYRELLAMLKQPLVKKMTELELQSQTPAAQQELMQFANVMMGQVSPERLALMQRLDRSLQATEISVDMQVMMARATMEGINTLVPAAQRVPPEQLDQMLEQMRMQAIYPTRQGTLVQFVYAYRPVTDEELLSYIELNETELGQWTTELFRNGWIAVTEGVSARLAKKMSDKFVEQNAL